MTNALDGMPPATPETAPYVYGPGSLSSPPEQQWARACQIAITILGIEIAEAVKPLLAEIARLTQERDEAETCLGDAQSLTEQHILRIEAAEARLATLTEKVTEYETRPWPGCRMLSLGDACDCSLCEQDRKMAALTAALEGLEQEIANTFPVEGAVTRETLREWADRLAALRTPEGK